MSTVFKGTLAFGLVTIPCKVSVAARGETVSFNMLHAPCHSRINMKTWCPQCEKEITRADTVKGFEVSKDHYVIIEADELKALKEESTKVIEIEDMVPAEAVDPLLFDASYYLEPELAGRKGYKLLIGALEAEKKYAMARITMSSGKEQIIVIRPLNGGLVFHTMYFADEIREAPSVDLSRVEVSKAEAALARKLVQANAAEFRHTAYHDEWKAAAVALIESKAAGKPVAAPAKAKPVKLAVDIMAALEASLKKPRKAKAA